MATAPTTATFSPNCDELMRAALQLAGLLPLGRNPNSAELSHARFFLDTFLKGARSAALTQLERTTLDVVAGQATYTLPADTIEVNEPLMLQVVGQTSQTWIRKSVFAEYQTLSNKATQGTPVLCYAEKQALVTLVFWPIPDQAYTFSYQRQRLVRDSGAGSTLDLTQRWYQAIIYQMAADMALAGSLDIGRVKYLQTLADRYIADAQGREEEAVDLELCLPELR